MANNVIIPAQGTGDTTPKVSTDQVSGDSSQVQNVQLASVAGGVITRNPTIPISAASLPLPATAATDTVATANGVLIGAVTETAPGTDTASSGLNGRLQRIAQRLTSLIALLPASLGQKTMANGLAVTIASDQSAVPVSGTVTTTPPSNASTNIAQINGVTPLMGAGNTGTGSLRVTVATDQVVIPVSDNAGSLTVDNAGTFAVQDSQVITDNAAFTDGTSKVQPVGYIFDEVAGTALTENDAAAARIDSKRAQVYVQEDATTRGQRQAISAAGAASSNLTQVAGATVAQGHGTAATALRVELPTDGTGTVVLAAGAATIGALTANQSVNQAQVAGTAVDTNSGNKSAGTQRIVIATDQPNLTTPLNVTASSITNPVQAATATLANVAASVSSVTLQASNAARKGLVIVNDSTSILYVKFGSTASNTSYTYPMLGSGGGIPVVLELPNVVYTGIVTGIWVTATGNARMTELT